MDDNFIFKPNKENCLALCGENDSNLKILSDLFDVKIFSYGDEIIFNNSEKSKQIMFKTLIFDMENLVSDKNFLDEQKINNLYYSVRDNKLFRKELLKTKKIIINNKNIITPKTLNQAEYINSLENYDITFGVGPAGTGKTFLAVAYALKLLLEKSVRKLILTRPVVEAGENLGFLPGDLQQKVNPYLRPIYDIIEFFLPAELIKSYEEKKIIEVIPLAYMRGRSLNNSFIILDEAQNTTREQMQMFLTRMGENSKIVITGDLTQIDLPNKKNSGLINSIEILKEIDDINFIFFKNIDVIRNKLVKKIVDAYEKY